MCSGGNRVSDLYIKGIQAISASKAIESYQGFINDYYKAIEDFVKDAMTKGYKFNLEDNFGDIYYIAQFDEIIIKSKKEYDLYQAVILDMKNRGIIKEM